MKKIILIISLLLSSISFAASGPILIQGAMDIEIDHLVQSLKGASSKTIGSWTYWQGKLNGMPVVISRTNQGMANAAAATALAIEQFHPSMIINQGTAGAHHPTLKRGDIVVANQTLNIGSFMTNLTPKGKGIAPKSWQRYPETMQVLKDGKLVAKPYFNSEQQLVEQAYAIHNQYKNGKVVRGIIGSADQWNRELDRINWLQQKYGTYVEDMETSAVALVAESFNVPFVGIRVVSNSDLRPEETYQPETAKFCQGYVLKFVESMTR